MDRRPGFITDLVTPEDWARWGQERADARREVERVRDRALLPPGILAKVGVLVVAGTVAFVIWLLLVLIGVATYDPAFTGGGR